MTLTVPRALRFSDVRDYLSPLIEARGFNPVPRYQPVYDPMLLKAPGPFVILDVGGGPGLTAEGVLDRVTITVRIVGRSQDFDGTEALAFAVDVDLCALDRARTIGPEDDPIRVQNISRVSGRPTSIPVDDSDRYQFGVSYVAQASSGQL